MSSDTACCARSSRVPSAIPVGWECPRSDRCSEPPWVQIRFETSAVRSGAWIGQEHRKPCSTWNRLSFRGGCSGSSVALGLTHNRSGSTGQVGRYRACTSPLTKGRPRVLHLGARGLQASNPNRQLRSPTSPRPRNALEIAIPDGLSFRGSVLRHRPRRPRVHDVLGVRHSGRAPWCRGHISSVQPDRVRFIAPSSSAPTSPAAAMTPLSTPPGPGLLAGTSSATEHRSTVRSNVPDTEGIGAEGIGTVVRYGCGGHPVAQMLHRGHPLAGHYEEWPDPHSIPLDRVARGPLVRGPQTRRRMEHIRRDGIRDGAY